jgi:hypothetical protein
LRGHVCLLSNRKSGGRGDSDHEHAAIHHAKILRLSGRHVERREQAFREGASAAVVDVDEAGAHAVVKEITANGGKAKGIAANLGEDANARRIVRETANAFSGLDACPDRSGRRAANGARPAPGFGAGFADGKGLPSNRRRCPGGRLHRTTIAFVL